MKNIAAQLPDDTALRTNLAGRGVGDTPTDAELRRVRKTLERLAPAAAQVLAMPVGSKDANVFAATLQELARG